MEKKLYSIKGFCCPKCAAKAVNHLAKNENIEEADLNFDNCLLSISYKGDVLSLDEIKSIIAEIEDDPIELSEFVA